MKRTPGPSPVAACSLPLAARTSPVPDTIRDLFAGGARPKLETAGVRQAPG